MSRALADLAAFGGCPYVGSLHLLTEMLACRCALRGDRELVPMLFSCVACKRLGTGVGRPELPAGGLIDSIHQVLHDRRVGRFTLTSAYVKKVANALGESAFERAKI
jgi:hypothetical protein